MKRLGRIMGMVCGTLLALLLSSCREEQAGGDDIVASTDSTTVQIQFTIDIAGSTATKADTWGGDYDKTSANNFESRISADSLQIILYRCSGLWDTETDGRIRKQVENISINGNYVTGKVTFEDASALDEENGYKWWIMVFANYGKGYDAVGATCPGNHYGNEVFNIMYWDDAKEKNVHPIVSHDECIPMFGFKKLDDIAFQRGSYTDLGSISMLRAVAKIRLTLDDEKSEGYYLKEASLTGYYKSGYAAPKYTENAGSITDLVIDDAFNAASWSSILDTEIPFCAEKGNGKKYLYVYVPEAAADNSATVSLTYVNKDTSEETTQSFRIGKYEAGKFAGGMDVIRNTVYDYTLIISKSDVQVSLTALPWEVTESAIGWDVQGDATAGIDPVLYAWNAGYLGEKVEKTEDGTKVYYYDTPASDTKNATVGDAEAKYCYVSYPRYETDDNAHVSDNRSVADFYFLITAPEGAVWKAHLTDTVRFEFETQAIEGNKWNWIYFDTEKKESTMESHYPVSVGIARANKVYAAGETNASSSYEVRCCRPYKITVKPKLAWYTFNDAVTDDSGYYLYDANTVTRTKWGEEWENTTEYKDANGNVVGGPYTDLYITISTSGKESDEQLLYINPAYDLADGISSYYKDEDEKKRYRFAPGEFTGQSIRIWQLKATNKKNADMAKDNTANEFFTTTTSDD